MSALGQSPIPRDLRERGAGALHKNGALSLALPAELVELVAERAAELVAARVASAPEGWIGVVEAAEHLACPRSRVYALVSAGRIPHAKDGSRLLFKRSQLDAWVQAGGARRP
jgi:excisionase family DNA binding protein